MTGVQTLLFRSESVITKIVKILYKFALKKSSKVFFQNNDDRELFIKQELVLANKCDVLPGSGVDVKKFYPQDMTRRDGKFVFLLVGRILWDKGVGEYVEASKELKLKYQNVEFHILGPLDSVNKTAVPKQQMQNWIDDGVVKYLGVSDDVREFIKIGRAHV